MEIEDGVIWVYGVGEDGVEAFTDFGVENLIELVRMYKAAEFDLDYSRPVRCEGEDGGFGAHVDAGAGVEAISTGTSAGTASPLSRPSRANRRHVNNWLVDNPLRRAVTDTNRNRP
jgi:hypothetical protein